MDPESVEISQKSRLFGFETLGPAFFWGLSLRIFPTKKQQKETMIMGILATPPQEIAGLIKGLLTIGFP